MDSYQQKSAKKQNIKIMTYNVHGSYSLANLSLILEVHKPSIVMLQEVKLSTEQLMAFARRLGYSGAANIDEMDHTKPGTGLLWQKTLPVTQVVALYPCRIQVAMLGVYPIINVYVPAGSHRAAERRTFFTERLFGLLAGQEDILPVIGGDWNCVTEKIDLENDKYFDDRKSQDLINILKEFSLVDAFRHLHGRKKQFTWQGRDGASASRLDRFYVPDWMAKNIVSMSHHAGSSDHKFGLLELELKNVERLPAKHHFESGYWKLNTAVLEDKDFQLNFSMLWQELLEEQGKFGDLADWWDVLAKKEIRMFLQHFSAARSRTRRQLKELLCFMLDKALSEKNWNEVAMVRGKLQTMMYRDNMGFLVRSRFKENQEVEKASLYHINREKKNAQGGNLEELVINGGVETDRVKVEKEVTNFFGKLFRGQHGRNGTDTGKPFQPDNTYLDEFLQGLGKLSPQSQQEMESPIKEDELEDALKKAANNKSPGLDGLPYEFYKAVQDVIGKTLVGVMNDQLERLKLMMSNQEGATRLAPKTDPGVVPRVDQLRPITLLCCDYKLLTSILASRMTKVMHEVILSGQLCSVKGKNIHYGTHNLLSSIQYIEERVKYSEYLGYASGVAGGGVLVSYDLFKAYDRVYIPYLVKVMKTMGFGQKFVDWIIMLHEGANTRFILNSLTKPVDILISVRQGDPIAMVLFIIYVEPLLMMIRKSIKGMAVMGKSWRMGENPGNLFVGTGDQMPRTCATQLDEDYVDDINAVLEDAKEMIVIDEVFKKFEDFSGAILNRSEKTKCMGLGCDLGRKTWPLKWVKVVDNVKIFGVKLYPTYKETLEVNWRDAHREVTKCLTSWNTRVLNSVFQRVEVLNIFVLPKLWYKAEALPLPAGWAAEFDKLVYAFVKMGKIEMMALQEMCNPITKGGLGLVCVRSKADSLFLKQTLRMLSMPGSLQYKYIQFFAGKSLRVADLPIANPCHTITPYYQYMVDLFKEGVQMELCYYCCNAGSSLHFDRCTANKLKTTAKEIYEAYTDSFPPPRVEYKEMFRVVSGKQWETIWARVASPMLDPMAREVVWRAIHNLLPTRERQLRLGLRDWTKNGNAARQVTDANCKRCNLRKVDDVTHMFTECGLVREAWCWVRGRLLTMLPEDMADLSNLEFVHMLFPRENMENECVWLMGTFMGWVYEEAVVRGRVLTDAHARGYMRYQFYQSLTKKMPEVGYICDITVSQNFVSDDNG